MKTVAVVSGGMDSVTLAHLVADAGHKLTVVTFDYGQRHRREIVYASDCARRLGARWVLVDLRESLQGLLSGSALTDPAVPVPEGHYEAETMRRTVVPNRNMILLAIAGSVAVTEGADQIATGVHAGDHAIYPDCRPAFVQAMTAALAIGNEGHVADGFGVFAPFLESSKADIVSTGDKLGVPWEWTWSCYVGDKYHCGRCGTCVERREAFELAEVTDPTVYEVMT